MAEPGDPVIRHRLAAAAAACAVGFAVVAALVTAGWSPLVTVDEDWSSRAYAFTVAHDDFRDVARWSPTWRTAGRSRPSTGVVAVVLALRRRWLLAWWLVLTVAGSALLSTVLKVGLDRLRPESAGELDVGARLLVPLGSHAGRDGDVRVDRPRRGVAGPAARAARRGSRAPSWSPSWSVRSGCRGSTWVRTGRATSSGAGCPAAPGCWPRPWCCWVGLGGPAAVSAEGGDRLEP